jgi:multiple sugar transport system permease protein
MLTTRRQGGVINAKIGAGTALLVIVAVLVLFPIYFLVTSSMKSVGELYGGSALAPAAHDSLGSNYKVLVSYDNGVFWSWFRNSVVYAGGVAVVGTYLSALTGYVLAKLEFAGRRAVFGVVLGSLMVPSSVLIIPIFIMEHDLHLADSYLGVILPLLVFPFGVYFVWAYTIEGVPRSLLDAGRMDGAGEWRIFNRLVLPTLMPVLVTLFLIMFVGTWNNYFLPLVLLHNSALFPLPVGLSQFLSLGIQGIGVQSYGALMVGAVISILPMIVLFPFLQRYVSRGLLLGAAVGD